MRIVLTALLLGAGCLVAPAPVSAQAQDGPSFQELEESLTCQCGCGLTVHSCNHLTCPSAIPLRAEIREQMSLGKSKSEILDHFRTTYGEMILSSPTTRGFNLVAWILPFFALAVGLAFVLLVVRRWVAAQRLRRSGAAEPTAVAATPDTAQYRAVLEREMRELDR